ncbi:hypothetical protein [Occallatibacter riparius]|uniref:Uncharacterized protein n=1 Tax=Occallatibacter riparius TaxID=1002689 RepID=A0A9J7BQT4_9BACT|nr:hypothetical protein [Occallatibacter riparius]UWZ85048.1 hypothetical protein MOP44_03675 [Occallatibacter riparius]
MIGLTISAWAADASNRETVSVAQLEEIVSSARSADHELARRISGLELTERLNADRRSHLAAALPGEQSRAALTVLADLSQLLDPPAGEIVPTFPPDAAARVQIFNRVVTFVQSVMHGMPNFFATRETSRFESRRRIHEVGKSILIQDAPFRSTDRARVTVLYRDGTETVEQEGRKRNGGLRSWGEFGPFLGVIAADMLKGKVTFHHWEGSPGGVLAVFDFSVPKDQSNYVVRFCCALHFEAAHGTWKSDYQLQPAYHGRVAIDPTSGAVLRMVVSADLEPADELSRADLAIEYGPVELGGKPYICPLSSVAVTVTKAAEQAAASLSNPDAAPKKFNAIGTTSLNHTTFEDYHLFRGDLRMVPDPDGPRQP